MANITPNRLRALRHDVAEATVRAYGAERAYAVALNSAYFVTDARSWFDVEANDTDELALPVIEEKKALYTDLKAAKHSNPSTVWARVRKYGREEAISAGLIVDPKAVPTEAGGSEPEGENSYRRSPLLRNQEELLALFKFNDKQADLPAQVMVAQDFIIEALKALGIDPRT